MGLNRHFRCQRSRPGLQNQSLYETCIKIFAAEATGQELGSRVNLCAKLVLQSSLQRPLVQICAPESISFGTETKICTTEATGPDLRSRFNLCTKLVPTSSLQKPQVQIWAPESIFVLNLHSHLTNVAAIGRRMLCPGRF